MLMTLFPDSNVFIHFKSIEHWNWNDQKDNFKIGLCLCTINELDKVKYSSNNSNVKRRVQELIKKFSTSTTLILNDVQFIIFSPPSLQELFSKLSLDKDDKDDLFIATILKYIETHPSENVQVISNDLGVQLKCKAHNIQFKVPAGEYLIIEEDNTEKEIRKLISELDRFKNLQPKLRLQFDDGETYKKFTIEEPWKEFEDEIEKEMEVIKEKNPLLEPEKDDDSNRFRVFDLYKKTPERVANYNEALREFYSEYEVYLRKNKVYSYKEKLTIILKIELSNSGNTPAEDIDVYMHFPDGFKLGEKDDYYAKESEPSPPDLAFYSMAPYDISKIMPSLMMPGLPDINFGGFSIKRSNSYEVKDHFRSIKHNHAGQINTLYVMFDRFVDVKGFEIEFEITAANMIDKKEGTLKVIIEKVENSITDEE